MSYTPTTEQMRNIYASVKALGIRPGPPGAIEYSHGGAQFDRWLAEYTAEVERAAAVRALEDAADEIFVPHNENRDMSDAFHRGADAVYDALRARAAEYRKAVKS